MGLACAIVTVHDVLHDFSFECDVYFACHDIVAGLLGISRQAQSHRATAPMHGQGK